MKKTNSARLYSSKKLEDAMSEITPLEMEKIRERMHLAARVEDLMKEKGFETQVKFAKCLNRKPSEINKWVSGTHNFTLDTLVEIKWSLGVRLADLFRNENIPETIHKFKFRQIDR